MLLKNIYPIQGIGRNLKKAGFSLDIFRRIPGAEDQNSIENEPLLRVMGVDKYTARGRRRPRPGTGSSTSAPGARSIRPGRRSSFPRSGRSTMEFNSTSTKKGSPSPTASRSSTRSTTRRRPSPSRACATGMSSGAKRPAKRRPATLSGSTSWKGASRSSSTAGRLCRTSTTPWTTSSARS